MSTGYNLNALSPGAMIQEYRVVRVLGAGSFGIIYLAENTYLPETVAIKEFLPSDLVQRTEGATVAPKSSDAEETYRWALDKFLKEARILWEIGHPHRHPNIVGVKRFHEQNGTAYMVMDFEEGEPLADRLERTGPLPEEDLRRILFPLLDGLEVVHEHAVLHRDIKPANILIRSDGSPVLIDFGAARQEMGGQAASVLVMFTPDYAAPEQVYAKGQLGPWTDIYALGATLYRAVVGKPPTAASQRALGAEHLTAAQAAENRYEPAFLDAIDAALELPCETRPQSVREWRALFQRAGEPRPASPTLGGETVLRPPRRQTAKASAPEPGGEGRSAPGPPASGGAPKAPFVRRTLGISIAVGVLAAFVAAAVLIYPFGPDEETPSGPSAEDPTADASPGTPAPGTQASGETTPTEPENEGVQVAQAEQGGAEAEETPSQEPTPKSTEGSEAATQDDQLALSEPGTDESAPLETPRVDDETIMANARAIAADATCGPLTLGLTEPRRLAVSGSSRNILELELLTQRLSTIDGVQDVVVDLGVRPDPLCDVLEVLGQWTNYGWSRDYTPYIRTNKANREYVEGELLQITATSTAAFEGYLYVDYIDSAGNVLHLLPTSRKPDNDVAAGAQVVLGKDRQYEIAPPHGQSILIAIASPNALFREPRPELETIEEYLPALRDTLGGLAGAERAQTLSDYVFITTRGQTSEAAPQAGAAPL